MYLYLLQNRPAIFCLYFLYYLTCYLNYFLFSVARRLWSSMSSFWFVSYSRRINIYVNYWKFNHANRHAALLLSAINKDENKSEKTFFLFFVNNSTIYFFCIIHLLVSIIFIVVLSYFILGSLFWSSKLLHLERISVVVYSHNSPIKLGTLHCFVLDFFPLRICSEGSSGGSGCFANPRQISRCLSQNIR